MNKKEVKIIDSYTNNNNSINNLVNNLFFTYYEEELKSIQRAIALLRQDLPTIIDDKLVRSKK